MSKQLDWDAFRYVLDDPTLDRSAFEARMLDDVDLALAVAEAVAHVDSLCVASFVAAPAGADRVCVTAAPAVVATGRWGLTSLAALAAALLLAVGLVNYGVKTGALQSLSQNQISEQSFVESWLALRQTEVVDMSSNLVDVSTNLESPREDDVLGDAGESSDEDWLMDAAREFYAQGEAG